MPQPRFDERVFFERLRSLGASHRPEISEIIQGLEQDIDKYACEISSLEAQLTFLRCQHGRLLNRKSTLSSLLAPIHRLPNELLTNIFSFVCFRDYLSCSNALCVASVCYKWRCLAVDCSSLWSNFEVFLSCQDNFDEEENSFLAARLDIYLQRSKNQPLTLHLDTEMRWEDEDEVEHPLLQKLVEQSQRWKHLTLAAYDADLYHSPILRASLSSLESLHLISRCNVDYEEPDCFSSRWFSTSANLRTLTLSCVPFGPSDALPTFTKVTNLTFVPNERYLIEPLKSFPNLRHLVLKGQDWPIGYHLTHSSDLCLEVPVTTLEVHYASVPDLADDSSPLELALPRLTAPTLTELTIDASGYAETEDTIKHPFAPIMPFIERSRCSLTVLSIKAASVSDEWLVNLLIHLPSLVELTITDSLFYQTISRNFIESLHAYQPNSLRPLLSGPIVPNLRSLVLEVRSDEFCHSSFVQTISSRYIPGTLSPSEVGVSCLRSVELHLLAQQAVREEYYALLAHIGKSGMRIVVKQNSNVVVFY